MMSENLKYVILIYNKSHKIILRTTVGFEGYISRRSHAPQSCIHVCLV